MVKESHNSSFGFLYDDQGERQVSEQIMNAYNSGVIDQEDGQFDMNKHVDHEM